MNWEYYLSCRVVDNGNNIVSPYYSTWHTVGTYSIIGDGEGKEEKVESRSRNITLNGDVC